MNSFNALTIGLISVVCLVAVIITYRVLKEEERKQKGYEESGQSAEEELQRSLEYEKSSWSSNIPVLTWIYVIATLLSIIALVVYMI